MKYLKQVAIIIIVSFLGEVLNAVLPLPIPASIYGLVIMLVCLMTKVIKLEQVKGLGSILIQTMPVMFIPAGVGLVTAWDKLGPILVPVTAITFITTIAVMVASGILTEKIIRKEERKKVSLGIIKEKTRDFKPEIEKKKQLAFDIKNDLSKGLEGISMNKESLKKGKVGIN